MSKFLAFINEHPILSTAVVAYAVGSLVGFLFGLQF